MKSKREPTITIRNPASIAILERRKVATGKTCKAIVEEALLAKWEAEFPNLPKAQA